MEYADGGDLYQRILEYQSKGRYMSESFIWAVAIQLCQALAHLHSLNILHRDIKSANVFLSSEGIVKLGDMNVSKIAKDGLLRTQTGTPYYASPEVWRDLPYDGRSDVWSLGCVLYEVAALKPPFRAEDMQGLYRKVVKGEYPRVPRGFSNDLASFLDSMLQVDAARRPTSAQLLQCPQVARRMSKYEDLFREKAGSSALLDTIMFPKNITHMSERLPGANYKEELKHNASEPAPFKLSIGLNLPRIMQELRDESAGRSRMPRKGSVERIRTRDHSDPASQLRILRENYGALKQVKARRLKTGQEKEESKHEMSLDSILARRGASSTGRRMSRQPLHESKRLQLLRLLQLDSSSRRLVPN